MTEPAQPSEPVHVRPFDPGERLSTALRIYRDHLPSFAKIVVAVVVPVQFLESALVVSTSSAGKTVVDPASAIVRAPALFALVAGVFGAGLLTLVASMVASAASMEAVNDAYQGRTPDWGSSLRATVDRLGPLLWLTLLFALGVGIGFALFFVPGVFLAVAWSAAFPILVFERHEGTDAL